MTLNDLRTTLRNKLSCRTDNSQAYHLSPAVLATITFLALVLIDQLTKAGALHFAPKAYRLMASPDRWMALAQHLHKPDQFTDVTAWGAMAVVGIFCMLPVPNSVKILWAAAAVSNHVEMLLRPGTMDFLAFRLMHRVYVANVADVYFAIGFFILAAWLVQRIKSARTMYEAV